MDEKVKQFLEEVSALCGKYDLYISLISRNHDSYIAVESISQIDGQTFESNVLEFDSIKKEYKVSE